MDTYYERDVSNRPSIVLPDTLHHARASALRQNAEETNAMKEVIKDLLTDRGVMPRKLGRATNPFGGGLSYRCHNTSKDSCTEIPVKTVQRNRDDSSDSTSITFTKIFKLKTGSAKPQTIVKYNLCRRLNKLSESLELENINKMIYNLPTHIVAIFKDYLIYDDANEFLNKFYFAEDSLRRLKKVAVCYCSKGRLAPSNVALRMQKVLMKGKERKERIMQIKLSDELHRQDSESSFINSKFMNSLAKEDFQNSRSQLPADSLLEQPNVGLAELLDKLSDVLSTKHEEEKCSPQACVRNVLNLCLLEDKPNLSTTDKLHLVASAAKPATNVQSDTKAGIKSVTKAPPTTISICRINASSNAKRQRNEHSATSIHDLLGNTDKSKASTAVKSLKRGPKSLLRLVKPIPFSLEKCTATVNEEKEIFHTKERMRNIAVVAGANSNTIPNMTQRNCGLASNYGLDSYTKAPSGSTIDTMKGTKSLKKLISQAPRRSDSQECEQAPRIRSERTSIKTRVKERNVMRLGNFAMKSSAYKI